MIEILCSHRKPRNGSVTLIVIHTNEGPEGTDGAANLARWLHQPSTVVGYHRVVDNVQAVITGHDEDKVNASGTPDIPSNDTNTRGWHLCFVGYAGQSPAQWADPYSSGELRIAASEVLSACRRFGVPVVKLTPDQVVQRAPGICGHGDITLGYRIPGGHSDPGASFPWSTFVSMASPPLFMAWKGQGTDTRIWWASFDGRTWGRQQQVPSVAGASAAVALAAFKGKLYAAWKGKGADPRIWWNAFDGRAWGHEQPVAGVGTSVGPAVTVFNGKLYMAWKGQGTDPRIWWTTYDGRAWGHQQQVPGVGTSVGPSLAVFNGKLHMAWKGQGSDVRIWWSSYDGRTWRAQQQVSGVGTSVGPSLGVFNGKLYMAWKGQGTDTRIWWTSYDGRAWGHQQQVAGVGTSYRPALADY